MATEEINKEQENEEQIQEVENQQEEVNADLAELPDVEEGTEDISVLKKEVEELKDKYLRLYSEFENFRRRTAKERTDLFKSANEDVLASLLPVLDDFERAQQSISNSNDITALKEGVDLIHNKLYKTLISKGLKQMESGIGKAFNSELQEAITQAPAASEELKGKVIDEIEKGYLLHDKVIRFAKVIIGS